MKVLYTDEALRDLDEILEFIELELSDNNRSV